MGGKAKAAPNRGDMNADRKPSEDIYLDELKPKKQISFEFVPMNKHYSMKPRH